MASPEPLKDYRRYIALILLNIAVIAGIIYFLRRESARPVKVIVPTPHTTAAITSQITVAVNGAVKQPGIYTIANESRLADAIEKAGGANPEADLSNLDLTRPLTNGEEIEIPSRIVSVPRINNTAAQTPPTTAAAQVNLNTATLEQLEALPGIGPALAQRILDYRNQHGNFKDISEIKSVRGIGNAIYQKIEELVTVQ